MVAVKCQMYLNIFSILAYRRRPAETQFVSLALREVVHNKPRCCASRELLARPHRLNWDSQSRICWVYSEELEVLERWSLIVDAQRSWPLEDDLLDIGRRKLETQCYRHQEIVIELHFKRAK